MKNTQYPNVKKATPADLLKLIADLRKTGHFFRVVFVKRTTDEIREMTCRFGVKKGTNGNGMKFKPLDKGLMVVWDSVKKDFRMVNLRTLLMLKYQGVTYVF